MRRPVDTSVEARERQLAAYRTMPPEVRLRLADEMSADVLSLSKAGARVRASRPGNLERKGDR